MSGAQAIRCLVAGRVQGVYYRAATVEHAQGLQLDGWVRNSPTVASKSWLPGSRPPSLRSPAGFGRGRPAARVDAVHLEEWTGDVRPGFVVAG